jgi:S1-C subfamily serine protease
VSWIDLVIIAWVVLAAVRGRALGAVAQLLGLAGFLLGLAIGAAIAVPIAARLDVGAARTIITIGIVLGVATLAGIGGNVLGRWASVSMRRLHLRSVDAVAGAAVAGLGALLSAWLVAGLFTQSSVSWLATPIQRSAVLTAIDAVMPPVPAVIARAQAFLSTEGFPEAFAEITQPSTSSVQTPSPHATQLLAAPSGPSVLKVRASGGCGLDREGTSFVVARDLVITNAHVVAGEQVVHVTTAAGDEVATVVVFDPRLDVAVLRVATGSTAALSLAGSSASTGTPAAVVGFPGGGPRIAVPAGIAGSFEAEGRDIYGGGLVVRPIYAVTASVRPGNSGSPLVAGRTAYGMVFSRSVSQADLAYAIQSTALAGAVDAASTATTAVSTGACTPG